MDSTDDVEARLQALRSKQQEAQRRYAQAEARLDGVRAQRQTLLDSLHEQGFETVESARKHVNDLTARTEGILSEIQEKVSGL